MTGSIDVTPTAMRKQAKDLRQFAADLREASASTTNRNPYAYGTIGVAWSWSLDDRFEAANRFTAEAADAAERVADEMDAMAAHYEAEDDAGAASLKSVEGDLR